MKHLPKSMPYEGWHNKKPNVSHLREFGSPVWVLLQRKIKPWKMKTKSKRRVYVGYDDGANTVRYYNAETRNVLTSGNFRMITPLNQPSPPEHIEVTPDMPCEGESTFTMPPRGVTDSDDITRNLEPKRKRKRIEVEEDLDIDEPRKTRGIRTDYKHLHDPFTYEEEEDNFLSIEEVYAIIAGDELTSLKDARNSPEWPEWQKAMKAELDLLTEKGTWELVQKPPDAVPISNKWIFFNKWNKEGEVVRYRARLVAKGYAQQPGFDYRETFLPVVRMDTLHAILALVPEKELKLHQMDVKGAYLNGTLQEIIYMKQHEGWEDETGRVCRLVKSLYGLKQAGREWNNELDGKLKVHEYKCLLSDPCVYIRRDGDDFGIMAIWVDDSLLFASSDKTMEHMKKTLHSEWDVTDLGDPSKIVGIEVTRTDNSITISQQRYIENVLRNEGMAEANPTGIPMDPNMKLGPNPDEDRK